MTPKLPPREPIKLLGHMLRKIWQHLHLFLIMILENTALGDKRQVIAINYHDYIL